MLTEEIKTRITNLCVFELNTAEIRQKLEEEFKHLNLVCNDTNNPQSVIDNGELQFSIGDRLYNFTSEYVDFEEILR